MGNAEHKKDKEKAFRFASTVFLFAAAFALIWGVGCFEDDDNPLGFPLLLSGFVLIGLMVWTFYHPFYPVLLGLIILIGLTVLLYQKADKYTFGQVGKYLFAGLGATGYALIIGFKEWRLKGKEQKNNIE